jgi:hypothetical protein
VIEYVYKAVELKMKLESRIDVCFVRNRNVEIAP